MSGLRLDEAALKAAARRLVKRYVVGDEERALRRARLGAIAERILAEVPGTAIASDQPYREADLAIDFCEDVPPLPIECVRRVVAIMESEGLTAKGGELKDFVIAGEDKQWQPAKAHIEDGKVIVSSEAVPKPVAVRYACKDNPEATLFNGAGLPATQFRTDDWRIVFPDLA